MARVILLLANFSILAIAVCMYFLARDASLDFALGLFTGVAIYQIAHRARYGKWFDIDY
jgi:hypothetical protein